MKYGVQAEELELVQVFERFKQLRGLLREGAGVYILKCREVENENLGLRAFVAHPCSVRCLWISRRLGTGQIALPAA